MNIRKIYCYLASVGGAGAMLLVLAVAKPAAATADGVFIVPPGQTLFGKSYNQLGDEWTNWVLKEPVATNPATDNDGSDCARNQSGRVWFLAATFAGLFGENPMATRKCTIPAGKAIFFAITTFVSFAPDFLKSPPCDKVKTAVGQIRCDINDDVPIQPNVGLKVVIDGKAVGDLFAYRVQSPPGGYPLVITPGSPFDVAYHITPGVRTPAVSDGYYIFLKPLPGGTHQVSLSADLNADGAPDQGANYTLTVQ